MALKDLKFRETDFIGKKIADLSNTPSSDGMTAESLKAYFDYIPKTMIALGAINEIIDLVLSSEGAENIGGNVSGVTGTTVQGIMDSLKLLLDDRYTKDAADMLLETKADKTTVATMIKSVSYDEKTGVFSFTEQGGTVHKVDTAIEKIAVNFTYDPDTQSLVMTLIDGTKISVPLNEFITNNEFSASDTIQPTVTNGIVTMSIREGSITDDLLSSAIMAAIQAYAASCETNATAADASAQNAKTYADSAAKSASEALESKKAAAQSEASAEASKKSAQESEDLARSYAAGGTGTRDGENTDNAMYYANKAATSEFNAAQYANGAYESAENAALRASAAAESEANAEASKETAETASSEAQACLTEMQEIKGSMITDLSNLKALGLSVVDGKVNMTYKEEGMPTEPILLDQTGKDMMELMRSNNALLQVIAAEKSTALFSDVKEIQRIVRSGNAPYYFNPGDKIIVPWKDMAADVTYEVPFNVVHFADATLKNGNVVPGMFLQWHYAIPFGIQFDNYEAFFYAETELPAGTYYITVGVNWGTYCKVGETYSFTLTQPVPAGGQLAGFYNMPDKSPENWKVYSFANAYDTTPIETVSVTAGANGTSLGTLIPAGDETTNSIQRVAYGYNRWSQCAIRQNLNSAEPVGKWWNPQNVYDRAPDQLKTKAGFLSGFNEDFLSCLGEVKVVTALNTATDGGGMEETYDKFFLPSLEQMHITPQISGEGETWEYWKLASESASPLAYSTPYPQMVTYALENHASPQAVRVRSAGRGNAHHAWNVNSSGNVSAYDASLARRCAPACVIC